LTYGNGLKVKYLYDSLDRVEEVLYNIGTNGAFVTVYTYQYDTNGRLFSVTDHQNNQKSRYVYDFGGNLLKTYTTDLSIDTILSSEEIKYDEYSRLSQITQPFEYSYSGGIGRDLAWYYFTYNEATGELSTLTIDTNNFKADIEFIVDPMGRLATKNKSYVWTYDDAGNIQTKSTYAFTTGVLGTATSTVSYGYNDATWGDLMKSYGGVELFL
jgi:YD repeat-containing protein